MELITNINIPTINPSPVKEAIVEIRFDSSIEKVDELFFSFYNSVKELFNNVAYLRLPVLDIPLLVRKANTNFNYTPHYQLSNENYILRFAPCAISIGIIGEYKNWENFFSFIKKVLECNNLPIEIRRIGLRYISFFPMNIFEKTNIELSIGKNLVTMEQNLIRHEFTTAPFKYILQINNIASTFVNNIQIDGSSIDLDIIFDNSNNVISKNEVYDTIDKAHTQIKYLLATILKEDFIQELQNDG